MDIISYSKAKKAEFKADSVQAQLNQAVLDGDQLAETQQARVGADGTTHETLKDRLDTEHNGLDGRITPIEENLSAQESQTAMLTHGTNVIESDQASPLKVEFYGNTLVNLLGDFKRDVSTFSKSRTDLIIEVDQTESHVTDASIKVTSPVSSGSRGSKTYNVNQGSHYLIIAHAKSDGNTQKYVRIENGQTYHEVIPYNVQTTWDMGYSKFVAETNSVELRLYAYFGVGSAWYDGIRLYEIDQATYDAIGVTLTDADVERMFPYVDSVQHVKNPVLSVEGTNLLPPFTEWNLHTDAKAVSSYELELDTGTGFKTTHYSVPVVNGSVYSISVLSENQSGRVFVYKGKDTAGTSLIGGSPDSNGIVSGTISTDNSFNGFLTIVINKTSSSTGKFTFKNPMLSLGSEPKSFIPKNDSFLYAETVLAGNSIKKDILFADHEGWKRQKWFETGVEL